MFNRPLLETLNLGKSRLGKKETGSQLEKIIGREREKRVLQEVLRSPRAEFLAIYGRRRVGKTHLIKNYIDSTPHLFFHVTGFKGGTLKEHLEAFSKQLGQTFYEGAPIAPRTRWLDAFEDLTQAMEKQKKTIVLFFDEFPWMATPRSRLLMALEYYWNRYWVFDAKIKLIICGSATSWVIEKIINNRGGLHNRVTRTIHLRPFTLYETKLYLEANRIRLKHKQILDLYVVLGGVPLYWSFVRKGNSAVDVIDELCFRGDGPLVDEFSRLFSSLFEDPKPYVDLIRIIAQHRYGIGQAQLIQEAKKTHGGRIGHRLKQLEEAGFVTCLLPYAHRSKGLYYQVDDEYSLFYLRWIEPNARTIQKKRTNSGFWLSQSSRPAWKSWAGLAFESVCFKHIEQIRETLKIDPGSLAGSWRFQPRGQVKQEGAQIDLLFDRPDDAITVCEIKNSSTSYAIDKAYAEKLLKKLDVFRKQTRTKKQLFLVMITTHGLKPTMYSEEIISKEVTLEDLFRKGD